MPADPFLLNHDQILLPLLNKIPCRRSPGPMRSRFIRMLAEFRLEIALVAT